jgi:DNA-binding winged helix-turn-helix (wHTH) protein
LGAQSSTEIFLFERFRLDRRGLFRRNEGDVLTHIEIGSRALDVLGVLLECPGDLVTRDEIMSAAWPTTVVEDNNLPSRFRRCAASSIKIVRRVAASRPFPGAATALSRP